MKFSPFPIPRSKESDQKRFCEVLPSARPALFAVLFIFLNGAFFYTVASQSPGRSDPKQVVRAAEKLIQRGEYREAARILRDCLTEFPADAKVKLKLAFTLMKERNFVEAYNLSFGVARDHPSNAHAFAVLGTVLMAGGRLNDSRMILSRGLQLNKNEALALASFGTLEFYENRLLSSMDYLAEAKYLAPENADYIFAYAQVAARAERYREAAAAYREFLIYSRNADDDRRARIKGLINFLEYLGVRTSLYAISGSDSNIDFELKGNRPVISLRVNNSQQPMRFVLDTGSGISVLSHQTAKRLKIKPIARGGHAKGIGGTGRFEIVYGFLREVQLGNIRVRNVPVYIREFHHNIHEIDGYIGISLISKFLTTVDYGSKTFSLTRFGTEIAADTLSKNISLPLRLTSSGFLSGEVQMEGVETPLNFIVDTGASVSVLSNTVASREPFVSLPRMDPLRVVGSAGVTENVESFTLPKISFGEHSRERITAIALDLEIINDASGFEQAGILGGNFFLDYRMTFDFRNSRLIFAPARAPSSADPIEKDEIKSLP